MFQRGKGTAQIFMPALGGIMLLALAAGEAGAQQNLFPTGKGSTWAFQGSLGDISMRMTATILSSQKEGSKTTVVMDWVMNGQSTQRETYVVSPAGVSRARSGMGGTGVITPPVPIIKYPVKSGASWTWKGSIRMGSMEIPASAQLKMVGRETVKIPAGTFNAYRVDMALTVSAQGQTQTIRNTYWFAPGAGLVKQSAQLPGPGGRTITMTGAVTKYTIK
jgi:hypothetical protein